MTEANKLAEAGRHCFTYCGDDKCDCPAKDAFQTLAFVRPALPVLGAMLRTIGNVIGAAKADEMDTTARQALREYEERKQ